MIRCGALGCVALSLALSAQAAPWDVYSDTWAATDGLGRKLPGHRECGPPKQGRTLGIFYFLWLGGHGTQVYDISKILAANPSDPPWGPPGAFHFWSEPLLGYYLSHDEFVIRKHAQMLGDAGVDVLIFDVTNGFIYEPAYLAIARVFTELRKLGQPTPQFAFITHAGAGRVAQQLNDRLYAKRLYPELWFRWENKPLLLAKPSDLSPELRQFFTLRESWAWSDPGGWFGDGKDKWPWLDHTLRTPGWHEKPGQVEQTPVCAAEHPTSNIGRSFHDGRQPPPGQVAPERGLFFEEQWQTALKLDPPFIFVTGWNEWVAQRFVDKNGGQTFLGRKLLPGGSFFVDQYSPEFSRDVEPMKGGFGDNYYWQFVAYARRYKGVRSLPLVRPHPVAIDGQFADWQPVEPEFRDTLGDPVQRNHPGWRGGGPYLNQTGRNDLAVAKVSRDASQVWFYAQTREPLTSCTGSNWMLLYIDADSDAATGWLGYDYVLNRSVVDGHTTTLEKNVGGRYQWRAHATVPFACSGRELELAVPRPMLGPSADRGFLFKWADQVQQTGDWSDFTLNGDAAPNDRYSYQAQFPN